MSKVNVRSFLSPTLVLLAMDWDEGFESNDFLGFAIKRTPGFSPGKGVPRAASSWLPNRIGFNGPNKDGGDLASETNPIQHFQWWDSRIDTADRGTNFHYEVFPVKGPWTNPQVIAAKKNDIDCRIPNIEEQGIGTYFNRAVVSSQAFARQFGKIKTHDQYLQALAWLSNGMNEALLTFIGKAKGVGLAMAAYHLTDMVWTVPALEKFNAATSIDYFFKAPSKNGNGGDNSNNATVKILSANKKITLYPRTKTNIMHDKFIVRTIGNKPANAQAVLSGTANFTTEGLTQQANVIHTFESPELASLYLARQILLSKDPSVASTASGAAWSKKVSIGDAVIRVFFAPEAPAGNPKTGTKGSRLSIDDVVEAVKSAKTSVLFSLFSATDKDLLDACKSVADSGKLMRGLVNHVSDTSPKASDDGTTNASTVAATWLYERSREDEMVVGHDSFGTNKTPLGFWQESNTLHDPSLPKPKLVKGKKKQPSIPPVYVHQKIVIVDGETDTPTIFVGSANLSGNSTWHNDENLLEITGSSRLAEIYVAEFMRLYEQYRARFAWDLNQALPKDKRHTTFNLAKDSSWAAKDYKPGTMEFIARRAFVGI